MRFCTAKSAPEQMHLTEMAEGVSEFTDHFLDQAVLPCFAASIFCEPQPSVRGPEDLASKMIRGRWEDACLNCCLQSRASSC